MLLADRMFQADTEKLLSLDSKLHGEFSEDILAEAADDHVHRIFLVDSSLSKIKELVLTDLRCGGFVLHLRR